MASNLFYVGLDEAGRGPLAGPVTAACVLLPQDFPLEILNDSKKLSEKKRDAAEIIIKEKACYGIAEVSHTKIDEINILQASLLAMKMACEKMLLSLPDWCKKNNIDFNKIELRAIADGNKVPDLTIPCQAVVKADAKYPCVMAASILAKVHRDCIMKEMDKIYPEYLYAKHKGYPTKEHREICKKIGPSPIQRRTFKY